jgi:hypothetical protein
MQSRTLAGVNASEDTHVPRQFSLGRFRRVIFAGAVATIIVAPASVMARPAPDHDGGLLSDEDIWNIVNDLRSLHAQK